MNLRVAALLLLLAPGAGCRGTTLRGGLALPGAAARPESCPAPGSTAKGALPGDEHGALGFVPRKEARSFYSGSGGQLWYYLNLYYWAPGRPDTKDLWIKAEVMASFTDLKHWPDAAAVAAPPAKTTIEYWEVGATGRAMAIDNHKDFWLAADNLCAGAVEVTMTLQLGRFRVKTPTGAWGKPRVPYVLDRRDYGRHGDGIAAGLSEGSGKFEPLDGEPVNVWRYTIPWSTCPGKFVRSNWEELKIPEIKLIRTFVPESVARAPVLTDDR